MGAQDNVIGPRVRAVENMVARSRAKTRRPPSGPACSTCHIPVWISFFFDGTGNNKHKDFPRTHSNVAALFDAHEANPARGVIPLYYEGLGTDFEFKDRHERKVVYTRGGPYHYDEEGYKEDGWLEKTKGLAVGEGIDMRLEKAMFDFESNIEQVRARTRIDEINLAAFGFSRGSTEARAFMHWLAAHSKVARQGKNLTYDGIPLNVKFLGIFDTVESVGGAGKNKRPELIKTSVPDFVQKCFHSCAAHELRHAFPLTALGTNRYVQAVVPGAHADVGGGYGPSDQGRTNLLARIHLLQMLDHARGAGLKMHSLAEMSASERWADFYAPSFNVPATAHTALRNYMGQVRKQSGTLQQVMSSHMDLYWNWIDAGLAMQDTEQKRAALHPRDNAAQAKLDKQLMTMQHLLRSDARTARGRMGPEFRDTRHPAPVVPTEVEYFFENYVHDSFEHFSLTGGTLQTDMSVVDYYEVRTVHAPQA